MFKFKLRVEGIAETQRKLLMRYNEKLDEYKAWLYDIMERTMFEIKNEIPGGGSGKTADSIYMRTIEEGPMAGVVLILTNSMVIFYLNFGTEAHGPVTARALRFKIGGKVIFAKWVQGVQPHGMIDRAAGVLRAELETAWEVA